MPFVVGAILVGAAVGAGAAAIAGTGLLAGALIGGAIAGGGALLASAMTPKITSPKTTKQFKADPDAGIPYPMGRLATGGNLIAQLVSNDTLHKWLHNIVVLGGCGPIGGIESFKLGKRAVTFSSNAATGFFAGLLWMSTAVGAVTDWSLAQPSGTGTVPEWTSAHKMTGYAAARLVTKSNADKFPGGQFDSPLWVISGVTVYDPREDLTQPGGSGSQRANDETTWSHTGNDNAYLNALTWCIGRRQNGILIAGVGAPIELIDVAAFTNGANVFEANSWSMGGQVTTRDDPYEVLTSILQAGAGTPMVLGGKISCFVNEPKTPVATITEQDLVGGISAAKRSIRRDRFNQVIPRYTSEDHDWEVVPAGAYAVSAYVSADGLRSREITYPLVQDADQATQLGAYAIYDIHERQPIVVSARLGFQRVRPGDAITVTCPTLGVSGDLLVIRKSHNPITLAVELHCRSETADKHENALELTGEAPDVPDPTRPDPTVVPAPGEGSWFLSGGSETEGGFTTPFLYVSGAVDNDAAEQVVFALSEDGSTPSSFLGEYPQSTTSKKFTDGIVGERSYYILVKNKVRGVLSEDWLVLGPVTAGAAGIPGGGPPADGTILFESATPGADEFEIQHDGFIDLILDGDGGTAQEDLVIEGEKKDPETIYALDAGDGGRSVLHIAVQEGDVISWDLGGGHTTGIDGEGSSATTTSVGNPFTLACDGGTSGAIDEMGATAGTDGAASGGDTDTTGGAANGGVAPGGYGAPGYIKGTYRTS